MKRFRLLASNNEYDWDIKKYINNYRHAKAMFKRYSKKYKYVNLDEKSWWDSWKMYVYDIRIEHKQGD